MKNLGDLSHLDDDLQFAIKLLAKNESHSLSTTQQHSVVHKKPERAAQGHQSVSSPNKRIIESEGLTRKVGQGAQSHRYSINGSTERA